jgi:hypothetical protein
MRGDTRLWGMVALGLLLLGCERADVNQIESGTYSLRLQAVDDDCEPARITGSFSAAVRRLDCSEVAREGLVEQRLCGQCEGMPCREVDGGALDSEALDECKEAFACRQGEIRTGGLSVTLPEGTMMPSSTTLVLDSDLERRTERSITECDGGTLIRRLSVNGGGDDTFDGFVTDTYAGLAGCAPGGSAFVPESSCQSQRRLTYRLREACDEPCLRSGSAAEFTCECP